MSDIDETNPNIRYINSLTVKKQSFGRRLESGLKRMLSPVGRMALKPIVHYLVSRGMRLFIISHPDRIGHLTVEPDWCLKRMRLGEIEVQRPTLLLRSEDIVANRALLDIWRQHMNVVSGGWRYKVLRLFKRFPELTIQGGDAIVALLGAADYQRVQSKWGDRDPLIKLTREQMQFGRELLAKLGVPEGAWFVCMHVRERGYSPSDDDLQGYRNADVTTYAGAAQEIAKRGGWVIRMGDHTMSPLAENEEAWPQTIDYALSDLKSAEADIFLCAAARFFLGTSSGLMLVSSVYGVPVALTNMIPYGSCLGVSPTDISIPKLVERDGQQLKFPEIFSSDIGHYRMAQLFRDAGLNVVDNTSEEIHAITVEIIDRLDGSLPPEEPSETARQEEFRALLDPSHYCYHSSASIGRSFLRQHVDLLKKT